MGCKKTTEAVELFQNFHHISSEQAVVDSKMWDKLSDEVKMKDEKEAKKREDRRKDQKNREQEKLQRKEHRNLESSNMYKNMMDACQINLGSVSGDALGRLIRCQLDGPSLFGLSEAEQERRLAEAKKHVKELESQVVIKSPEELKASAKDFRDQNACTLYDETTQTYKYRSCCGTKVSDLGVYGVGVALYFQFIRQMGVVFLLCAIVLGPNLAFNIMGNMVNENSALYKYLGMTTIGNLGACEGALCETDEDLRNRCLIDEFPCETMLK
ncbi:unnamed protein product, partial [Symbiodinium necroappetens]